MRVRVLGPVEVRAGSDHPWTRPPPQQRVVLATLAAPPARTRDLDGLTAAIWHGPAPDNAHRLVQALVSRLRAAIGQDNETGAPLRSVEEGWRLDLASDELDASRFDVLVDRAWTLFHSGDVANAATVVDEALGFWRGRPFGDLADDPIVVAEASRLEERRLDALQVRMQVRLATGRSGPVIAELKELLVDHPLREQLWGLLMVALHRAGRRAEALVAYQRVRERLVDELGVGPGPELQELHQRILRRELDTDDPRGGGLGPFERAGPGSGADGQPVVRGLPTTRTSFVGRHDELVRSAELLAEHQVVTVVGPGGVGKTRLATTVAEQVAPDIARGGAFVDLTRVDAAHLPEAVARVLGVVESAHEPLLDTLLEHVRRGPLLLVLDNCEHLLSEVGDLITTLAAAAPDLVVLATSRERLAIGGERVLVLPPLAVGDGAAGIDVAGGVDPARTGDDPGADDAGADDSGDGPRSDAARLFLDRTRAVAPDFRADPGRVEELCRRLDGLPLAIELAAARGGSLGIDGLLSGLDDRLRLLRGAGGGPARHRSLRAVLDWSHDLLDDAEQAALRRLAVFAGAFDLSAATSILDWRRRVSDASAASDLRVTTSRAADLVGRLADKSLLVHHQDGAGSRWVMLDTVREYALDRLAASGEGVEVRRRYLHWAVTTALDLVDRMAAGTDWLESFRQVEGDLRSALAADPEWREVQDLDQRFADETVPAPPPDETGRTPSRANGDRLDLAFAVAQLQARTGSYRAAQDAYETAIGLARAVGGPDALARAALGASVSGMVFGVSDRARVDWIEEALAALDDDAAALRARLLARLSMELYWSVDRGRSLALADEALATARADGDDAVLAQALYAKHYTNRGPDEVDERVELSAEVAARAERGGATDLALAGRAAHVVDLLAVGDLTGMDAALGVLWEAADRLERPGYQWYTDVYRVVRALLEGRFDDADALVTTAIAAGRNVAEFTVGLYFAEAVTDLRDLDPVQRRQRAERLGDMADRFPRVLVWRCLALLNELAMLHPGPRSVMSPPVPTVRHEGVDDIRTAGRALVVEVLDATPRDAHWVVEACLLAELGAELGDAHLAARLDEALRPYAGRLAVAGRVGACRGSVSHALGLVRWALEDLDGAVGDLAEAVAQHDVIGARPHLARSLSTLARVRDLRGASGDSSAASAERLRARAIGHDLDLDAVESSHR